MKLTLKFLKINNFRVIQNFEITPNGHNLAIYGKNKRGKTTIYDAFLWLLFGKNSAGESKFSIKPTTLPIETENSVEAEFDLDGKPLHLKKVYASKYVKNTGDYKSSETEYYFNGVPKKKNEYEAEIAKIINEEQFKLLTNPKHFAENLHWEKRREILFNFVNSLTDAEIAEQAGFSEIVPDLEVTGGITQLSKAVAMQIKNNAECINMLPKLINENALKLVTVDYTASQLEKEESEISEKISANTKQIGKLEEFAPETTAEFKSISQEMHELENENIKYRSAQREKNATEKAIYMKDKYEIENKIVKAKLSKSTVESKFKRLTDMRNELLSEKRILSARTWTGSTVCETCGQPLPEDKIEAARTEFNAQTLEMINKNEVELAAVNNDLVAVAAENNVLFEEITKLEKELAAIPEPIYVSEFDLPDYSERMESLNKKLNAIASQPNPNIDEINRLLEENNMLNSRLNEISKKKQVLEFNAVCNQRNAELKQEQVALRNTQAQLLRKQDIINDLVRYKADSVTAAVNDKFKLVKFKLFEPNKTNDGLTECCELLAFNASRYNDINTAGKILVGVDIISTLAKHYELSVPLFIDNIDGLDNDSYKQLTDSVSGTMQLITLRVSDTDETLRTEEF